MDAIVEFVSGCVDAWSWVTSVALTCLIAGLELLLNERVCTGELVRICRASVFYLEEALVVLMGLVAEVVVAGEFGLEVAEGVEVVERKELLADAFHHSVVALPVASHTQLLFIMTGRQNWTAGTAEPPLPLPSLALPLLPPSRPVHYYSSFYLFNSYESELLYSYKYFIENMILKLGEDWRIEANLLSQEIVDIRNALDGKDHSSFILFNEFLAAYLKDKIGREHEHTNYP